MFLRAQIKKQFRSKLQAAAPGIVMPKMPAVDARTDELVMNEVRDDVCRLIIRGVQRGVTRDPAKTAAIAQSPAIAELLRRSTTWVGRLPDPVKLSMVIAAKVI